MNEGKHGSGYEGYIKIVGGSADHEGRRGSFRKDTMKRGKSHERFGRASNARGSFKGEFSFEEEEIEGKGTTEVEEDATIEE